MHYHSLGEIPPKRHTQFRQPDGSLYKEELFSTEGFSDLHSLLYHCNPPTQIVQVGEPYSVAPKIIEVNLPIQRSTVVRSLLVANDRERSPTPAKQADQGVHVRPD